LTKKNNETGVIQNIKEIGEIAKEKAIQIIAQVKKSITTWRQLATKYKIPKAEQERMSAAFLLE
jgi:cysteine sulfinate desulfinase/cysteine desulfurase-like protein